MIINLRGTSGAGKSTIVNHIMDAFPIVAPVRVPGRKQPLYYLCRLGPGEDPATLAVIGSYESPCGGCDTIKTKAEAFDLIRALYGKVAQHVLFEGLLISEDTGYTQTLDEEFCDVQLVLIDLPVEECIASVNLRRAAKRGPDAPEVNPENTTRRHTVIARAVGKLRAGGVHSFTGSREACESLILEKVLAL